MLLECVCVCVRGVGVGGVILESLNCNHHLQLLPPRCTHWTSTERGREKVEGAQGEAGSERVLLASRLP